MPGRLAANPCTTTAITAQITQVDTFNRLNGGGPAGADHDLQRLRPATGQTIYGFGPNATTRGAVFRQETWTYPTTGIVNLLEKDSVADGSNNQIGLTNYTYDETTGTGQRGNLTTTQSVYNSSGANVLSVLSCIRFRSQPADSWRISVRSTKDSDGEGKSDIPYSGALLMKATLLIVSLVMSLASVGCSVLASTNPNDYIGEYVFTPGMEVQQDFAAFLILTKDHTAIEIRYPNASGQISTTTEGWHLDHGTDEEAVIGKRAYPIERTRSTIRLIINGDLGQHYEKVR